MTSHAKRLTDHALDWMREASRIALSHYNGFDAATGVMSKADDSPLTRADIEVDAYLVAELAAAFPDIPVVTEEAAASHQLDVSGGTFFLVDPIDGTKEFINKRDEFTVNIGLIVKGFPVAGMVCAPALGRCFVGNVEAGAHEIDLDTGASSPIRAIPPDPSGYMVVASRSHLSEETREFIERFEVRDMKSAGSSLKFCLIASGEADLYPRFGPTMEWDTAAGHAVLLAAGGFVNNLDGSPLGYGKPEFRNPWFIAGAKGAIDRLEA